MKLFKSFVLLVASLVSVNSFAGLINDIETVNKTVAFSQQVSWVHNILEHDFALGSAESATITIQFRDDKDPWYAPLETALIQIGFFDLEDGGIFLAPTSDWSGNLGFSSLLKLNADGTLFVEVTSLLGDFFIANSTLAVTTKDAVVTKVPEPSTWALMLLCLLGVAAVRKIRA